MAFLFPKQRKPKSFNFEPRYYNQRKEEREKRFRQIDREIGKENSGQSGSNSSGAFFNFHTSMRHKAKNQSNIVLIILIVVFALFVYFFLVPGAFEKIVKIFVK
jgi:hypothetical protein